MPAGLPYGLQRAIPSARGPSTSPSLLRLAAGCWNVDQLSIGLAFRLILRTRLTLNRLSLFRKPWSSGEGVSHPLYRYLCLHLLFQTLQRPSREGPLSRSYRAILPSSLATDHSSAFGFSPRPPVSVSGTGRRGHTLEVFLGSMLRTAVRSPEGLRYSHRQEHPADLPTGLPYKL